MKRILAASYALNVSDRGLNRKSLIRELQNISLISSIVLIFLLCSCSTGIESTKAIKLSRNDARAAAPTPEKLLTDSLVAEPLGCWFPGREFMVTDSKVMLLFDGKSIADTVALSEKKLQYAGADEIVDAGGNRRGRISFKVAGIRDSQIFNYILRKPLDEAKTNLTGLDLPMLIDMQVVESARKLLTGRTFWTRSGLWYDKHGVNNQGLRFVQVQVVNVLPGNTNFPLFIEFRTTEGESAYYYMNINAPAGSGAESRTLPELFSLNDPRKSHKNISDENWALIQRNRIAIGMTKEECRLALGNPSDVASGHNWSNTIDFWGYPDGKFLRFEDGLLIEYR
ncbi:MAG: hypothetical protein K2M87_05975 [Muribaculaceae bacterium]|nr:hypothetical protein [Muribaculaceae bacterium]